jgi:hypothetical protein
MMDIVETRQCLVSNILSPEIILHFHNIHPQLSVISQKATVITVTHSMYLRNNICCLSITGNFIASGNSNFVLFSTWKQ